jgi:hypothetical protein
MPSLPFDVGDAGELAELLEFLSGWLESDRAVLTASLARFVGVPDYGPDSLREDFPIPVPAGLRRQRGRVYHGRRMRPAPRKPPFRAGRPPVVDTQARADCSQDQGTWTPPPQYRRAEDRTRGPSGWLGAESPVPESADRLAAPGSRADRR